ncbi:MAG: DMT family transporter [Desulfatiglandales bacterium]
MVYIKLLLTALFWGGTFIAGRLIADRVQPFSAAFLRFAVASSLLLLLMVRQEGRLPRINRAQFVALFFLGMTGVFAYNALFFKGLQFVSAGRASLIIANNPVFITLFAALIFKEKLSWVNVGGILLSVTGVIIVISKGDPGVLLSGGVGWGELLIFGCVASWVAYSLIGKAIMRDLSPLVSVSYSALMGTAALIIPALVEGIATGIPDYSILDWTCISYLGVFGTVLGFVWYYEGIKALGATRAGQFINFVPVCAILLAFLILGEPFTWSLLVGAGFVFSGVTIANMKS